ncbi:MAG: phosphatidylserine decarboxylase family protein [Bacteroidetes bacterium CG_4_10_14_3_um_filter_42_6]|nr:MAG: phosphatidylserine decarboxylase family protein [Bacteroidetes bacterium CG_4_10_14_3_um_filter_42_6]
MKIHHEGNKIILFTTLWVILAALCVIYFIPSHLISFILFAGLAIHFIWTISFFRVPDRKTNLQNNAILSSAYGKVVTIEEVTETEYFKDKRLMISVFMSPFDVHVNWYPMDGEVVYTHYHPGKYLAAYNPKSSVLNERNIVVIENKEGKSVLIRQIAGVMARRIISKAKKGDQAGQGCEFGIIRFGSRVDFFMPVDVKMNVKIGDKVKARQTVIAYF